MFVKEIFIKKSAGFHTGKYIDIDDQEHYIPGAFQCCTGFGCKRAIKKWMKQENISCEVILF